MESQSGRKLGSVQRINGWLKRAWRALAPGPRAWRGAAWGALAALVIILLAAAYGMFGRAAPARFLIGAILFLAAFAVVGGLLTLVWRILKGLPAFYVWVVACAVPAFALLALTAISVSIGAVAVGLGTLAVASLVGAGFAALNHGGWSRLTRIKRVIAAGGLALGVAGVVGGAIWLLDAGSPLTYPPNAAAQADARIEPLDVPDPSQPGPYPVRTLFYGSGEDRHRPEYEADVDLVTGPVDGSALIERWSGLRTAYWGFGPEALQLNGRVWYPEGPGALLGLFARRWIWIMLP